MKEGRKNNNNNKAWKNNGIIMEGIKWKAKKE